MKKKIIILILFFLLIVIAKISVLTIEKKEIESFLKTVKSYKFDKVEVKLAQSNPLYPLESKIFFKEEDLNQFKDTIENMIIKKRVSEEDEYIAGTSDYFFIIRMIL